MPGNKDVSSRWFKFSNEDRGWEWFYRTRWSYDKVVRTSHGVNCSMSCSWMVYVKDGLVAWELQATDYPQINPDIPNYEPRGCQRGISTSWYLYSPLRVKYPYVRGILLDMYREARSRGLDPVEAWASIVGDPEKSKRYKEARGKGGWKRVSWDEAVEIIAGALIHTLKKYGPDRIASFSPIPAMSIISFISGMRFTSLIGGTALSFYDWYNDLPTASPEVYGEQTDVHESADWFNATYWIIAGTSLPTTRTADAHFMSEAKYNGTKVVVVSPDFYDHVKFADTWVQIRVGTDAAFAIAMAHVVMKEFHIERRVESFIDYVKRYTNLPFLVKLDKVGDYYIAGRFLRASEVDGYKDVENSDWKLLVMDSASGELRLPKGSIGFRYDKVEGNWNLKMEDPVTGEAIDPRLTLLGGEDDRLPVAFPVYDKTYSLMPSGEVGEPYYVVREVPVKKVDTLDGTVYVTTAYDLLAAHLGISRGLGGDYPVDYNDPKPYTPAWQESITGVSRDLVIKIAREFAENAEKTGGRSLIIMGPGIQHWFHQDLNYRTYILLPILCGCVGKNGGGWCHYVGTEKIRPLASALGIAFALDWIRPPRHMNTTTYWYIHTGQWRYDAMLYDPQLTPWADKLRRYRHPADMTCLAVRLGWLPFYPSFNKNVFEIIREALEAGAKTDEEIIRYVVESLKEGRLRFAVEDPDDPFNSPKVLFVWRGNLLGTSMRGNNHAFKTLLGTHHAVIGEERAKDLVKEIVWRDEEATGKLDLLVNLEFRMISTANYADIVLPAAHWYEKHDLTCGDLHTFIHPFTPATDPYWECKHDYDAFKLIAKKFSELAAKHFDGPVKDLVVHPLLHDSPMEISQPWGHIKDWKYGEVEPIPGKTMPKMVIVERDYSKVYDMYVRLGPKFRDSFGAKGIMFALGEIYDALKDDHIVGSLDGYPSLEDARKVAEAVLRLAPETDGDVSYKAWKTLEKRTGLKLADLIEHRRHEKFTFDDLVSQPRRVLTSPMWYGIEAPGRTYTPYAVNVERLVPFRTLSGRQEIYIDHGVFRELGESLPIYKPPIDQLTTGDMPSKLPSGVKLFRYITPHGKWGIHSTFYDNLRMQHLHRGGQRLFINPRDAEEIGVDDNEWVEVFNGHGIMVCRVATSHRVPRGMVIMYHMSEKHIGVPISKLAQELGCSDISGGNTNAVTRILQNPAWMVGGYAQLSYFLNYWGTCPSERDIIVAVRRLPLAPGEKVTYVSPSRFRR